MKNKTLILFSVTILIATLIWGCEKKSEIYQSSDLDDVVFASAKMDQEPEKYMLLGNQLENPYSVSNMQRAYDSLKFSPKKHHPDVLDMNISISHTHLYIMFQPKDVDEYNYLIDESGLSLFTYPLDYEVIQEGHIYERPGFQEGDIPWLYTTIPVEDADSYNVDFHILDYCYIPEELTPVVKNSNPVLNETLFFLELEALLQTNNITQLEYADAVAAKSAKYPTGYIKVMNTTTNSNEGVKKVKVRVHNIIKWCETYTDETGYYKMSKSYLTNVHYAVIYENQTGFKIWGNLAFLAPANHNMGWYSNSGYSTNIGTSSDAWLWSTVNNSAYIYREKMCTAFGILKPASDLRIWTFRSAGSGGAAPMAKRFSLPIATLNSFLNAFSVTTMLSYIALVLPDVFILGNYNKTIDCYSVVFHELSHASHYAKAGSGYWLNYIQGIINNKINNNNPPYGNGNETKAGYIGVGEMWGNYFCYKCMNKSTALGFSFGSVALTGTNYWFKPQIMKYLDETCGLSSSQIFECLTSDVTSHALLKSKLKTKYPNYVSCIESAFSTNGF